MKLYISQIAKFHVFFFVTQDKKQFGMRRFDTRRTEESYLMVVSSVRTNTNER